MHFTCCKEFPENVWKYLQMKKRTAALSFSVIQYVHRSLLSSPKYWSTQKNIISAPTKVLIHRLAEVGSLYNRVEKFVRQRESSSDVGMIEQSLCHYLQAQLTEYYRLIAILETQLFQDNNPATSVDKSRNNMSLSLRRLDVWINEWRMRMKMMSVCVEGARSMSDPFSCLDWMLRISQILTVGHL